MRGPLTAGGFESAWWRGIPVICRNVRYGASSLSRRYVGNVRVVERAQVASARANRISSVRWKLALLVLVILLAGCGSTLTRTVTGHAATPSATRIYLPSTCVDDKIRPRSFVPVACGDAQSGVEHLSWTGWGDPVAKGVGYAYANDCHPDCVSGGTHQAPAEVYVSTIQSCPGGRLQYQHVTIAVVSGPAVINGQTLAQVIGGTYSVPCANANAPGSQQIDPGP